MARILVVDNDQFWQDLIRGSLPDHDVDSALSYDGALAAIQDGADYDVAIVDLNLIDPPGLETGDGLGGRILDTLRSDYPLTRRIALTAYPPSAVMKIVRRYGVDDLLLKANMTLAVVSEVVQAALDRTSADLPPGVRGRIADLRQEFGRWREERTEWFAQRRQGLRNDLRSPVRGAGQPDVERAALQGRLAELERQRQDFSRECADVMAMMASISGMADIAAAELVVEQLKRRFGTDDNTAD